MKYTHTYTRTTDHSIYHIAKVCNTASLINVMAAVYVFNVEEKPSNYEKGMRYELSLAFSLRIAQLSQMESNIIADYFTAPTIKPHKKAVPYVVTITYYGQEGGVVKSDPVSFTNQRDALAYAKRKVREAGSETSGEAYIQRDTVTPYDASYNLESGLTVY